MWSIGFHHADIWVLCQHCPQVIDRRKRYVARKKAQTQPSSQLVERAFDFFFCSNALIALARLLCKCFLAELITVGEVKVDFDVGTAEKKQPYIPWESLTSNCVAISAPLVVNGSG